MRFAFTRVSPDRARRVQRDDRRGFGGTNPAVAFFFDVCAFAVDETVPVHLTSMLGSHALSMTRLFAESGPDFWMALGRLHPVFLHFPIALALVAALAEGWRVVTRRTGLSPLTLPLLNMAALSAIAASLTGWVFASYQYDGDANETLFFHRWLGIATAVLLSFLALWGLKCSSLTVRAVASVTLVFRCCLLTTAVAVGLTGHLGGDLAYGEGFFLNALCGGGSEPKDASSTIELTAATTTPLTAEETVFMEQVLPILSARCFECHGPQKQKGGLRLDSRAWLFSAQEEDWVVVPGKPDESAMLERVQLAHDDPDVMPPKGEPLTADQISTLRNWIAAGAAFPAAVGASTQQQASGGSSGVTSSALSALGYVATIGVLPSIDEKVRLRAVAGAEVLAARGIHVQPLAAGSPLYDISASRVEPPMDTKDAESLHDVAPLIAHLNLSYSAVTDEALARIGQLALVERLRLDHTSVSDAGVQALGVMPKLESINLVGTNVTPAIGAWLSQQPSLKRVYVWMSKISDVQAKEMAQNKSFEVISGDLPLALPTTPLLPAEATPPAAVPDPTPVLAPIP